MTIDLYILCKGDKRSRIIWSDVNKMKFGELIKTLLGTSHFHLRKDNLPLIMVVDASNIAADRYIYQQQESERLILGHFCCVLGKCLKARSLAYLELKAISVEAESFKNLNITQPKHMELLCTIKQYVIEIIYIPGSQNCITDYISRCTSANDGGSDKVLKEINFIHESHSKKDEITKMIKNNKINIEKYDVKLNDIKYVTVKKDNDVHEKRLVIPIVNDNLAWHMIKSVHDKYEHIVGRKLIELVERKHKMKDLKVKVDKFIKHILTCQKTMEKNLFRPELETIQYSKNVWKIITTDICVVD
uniref:RT_RNaseH_2 domain-containing protein n=1 Tax=Strongyloides venezuelensis TaxID=75913 RepID=A0A0K0FJ80_STRVS